MLKCTVEIWRIVPSQPHIMASSFGRIQKIPHVGDMPNGPKRHYETKPVDGSEEKSATGRSGSPRRRLLRCWKSKRTFKVHILICEAFHGEKPTSEHIVLHLDEDPSNNKPENLRWGTRKENQNFPKALAAFKARTGENSTFAKSQKNKMEQKYG